MDVRLTTAAQAENIKGLYNLIKEKTDVLAGINDVAFAETPIHTAASTEHTNFAIKIMSLKPSIGRKLNPDGLCPLDLALRKGRTETTRILVWEHPELPRRMPLWNMDEIHYHPPVGRRVVVAKSKGRHAKLKEFGGKRDEKELDNFIWHMERYFEGASITDEKAKMDEEKVKAIKEWEAPTKVSELRSFLGLANYYRRFIKGYSAKAAPLTDLLKKGKAWEWSKRCQTAFEGLKDAVTEEPVLALPDHTKVFELQMDASDFAIGGVLMQEGHPIAFESRKLNDTERRYMV
ncbi:hypothetical protein RJ639_046706 [Escallonia herrerae]|uniref:Reverse transcriptase/retrotransposon-derived protein RNase H-like domain-containing protein n=1 Tax=Escallonia herrerae TaxID=1293975 RepID=A0AA88W841_9ASTE|nr:hypothetical protein RJ639_046706 [Escallonia herrerae]